MRNAPAKFDLTKPNSCDILHLSIALKGEEWRQQLSHTTTKRQADLFSGDDREKGSVCLFSSNGLVLNPFDQRKEVLIDPYCFSTEKSGIG